MGYDIKEKIYQRLANKIFFRILDGRYPLGSKLPSYIDISKEAGSRPETVRKAIRELEECGLVEKRYKTFYVTTDKAMILVYKNRYCAKINEEYWNGMRKINQTINLE